MSEENESTGEGEATSMSMNWLLHKTTRVTTHALLTIGSEYALAIGGPFLKAGIKSAVENSNPVAAFVGAIPDLIGLAISSQGAKHSPFDIEKALFWGIKGALIVSPFIAPQFTPVLALASATTTFIGMRNRK